jgi:hypothetical protein
MDTDVKIFIAIVVMIAIVVPTLFIWISWGVKRDRAAMVQRKIDLAAVAKVINADYLVDDQSPLQYFKTVPFWPGTTFDSGDPKAKSVMRGLIAGQTHSIFFDFGVMLPSTDNSCSSGQTVAMFHFGEGWLPSFIMERRSNHKFTRMSRESELTKYAPAAELPGREAFLKRYHLHGKDVAAIQKLFRPELCQFIEVHGDWMVESTGEWLAICRQNYLPKVAEYPQFVADTTEFLAAFASR